MHIVKINIVFLYKSFLGLKQYSVERKDFLFIFQLEI